MNCGSLSLTSTTVMLTSVELDNDGRPLSYTVNVVICTKPMNVYSVLKKTTAKAKSTDIQYGTVSMTILNKLLL